MNALPKLLNLALLPLLAVSLQAASSYTVRSGDTLSSIARKNGTTATKLMRENGISNPNLLKIGQVLKVPGSSATNSKQKPKSAPARDNFGTSGNYTVKAGETLYAIARKHGLSVSQLTSLNPGLEPSRLSVGQKLQTTGKVASKPKAAQTPPKPKAQAKPKPKAKPAPPTPEPVIAQTFVSSLPPVQSLPESKMKEEVTVAKEQNIIPSSISSVMVTKEISFGALANKHRTTTRQLNELNGWSLKPTTILAKESEVYVPGS